MIQKIDPSAAFQTRRVFKKDKATLHVISRGHEDTKHFECLCSYFLTASICCAISMLLLSFNMNLYMT